MAETTSAFRLAAVADLHCRKDQLGRFREMIKMVNGEAEGLVIAGDLTDHGTAEEALVLAEQLVGLSVPCAAVLGNHDFEGGAAKDIVRIMGEVKVRVLDGDYVVFEHRLGIAGVKGFAGGFESRHAPGLRRAGRQGLRAGGRQRGAEARGGAGAARHREADRAHALRAHPGHGGRRGPRHPRFPRHRPPALTLRVVRRPRGAPRPRPPRAHGERHAQGDPGLQRVHAAPPEAHERQAVQGDRDLRDWDQARLPQCLNGGGPAAFLTRSRISSIPTDFGM